MLEKSKKRKTVKKKLQKRKELKEEQNFILVAFLPGATKFVGVF